MNRSRVLLSNDDGIHAVGLRSLAAALESLAEVWIVAPDRERSAASHAISLHQPLRVRQLGPREFSVDGTPADCVYLGLNHLLPQPPDLVIGGINHGPNLGNDVLYSGTVSVAMEGALFGRSAIAMSLCLSDDVRGRSLAASDFAVATEFAAKLASAVLAEPMPPGVLLNVNVPFRERAAVRGHKLCRLGYTDWADAVTVREDPRGRPYYWIAGQRNGSDAIGDSDNGAIDAGFISVTPIHYDVTDYRSFGYARKLDVGGFARERDALGDITLPHPVHPRAPRRP